MKIALSVGCIGVAMGALAGCGLIIGLEDEYQRAGYLEPADAATDAGCVCDANPDGGE